MDLRDEASAHRGHAQQQQPRRPDKRQQHAVLGAKSRAASNAAPGKGPKQVKFEVVYCSGEDPEFPASELNVHSPQTQGWQSPPFCAYPQEIGLGFLVGEVDLAQLQILSHQSKIATKIDVYVGRGASYDTCSFKRLGHLSLDSNERSEFGARELKSVYIGKQGSFLKLLIHKCHLNRLNIYNQAGIMAINVLGHPLGSIAQQPSGRNGYGIASNQDSAEGRGGDRSFATPATRQVPPLQDLAVDMNFDPVTAKLLREVHEAKERAVEEEEYELAKQLKEAEGRLKHIGVKLARLEAAKRDAVACEDYDQAAIIKRDIQSIRGDLDAEIAPLLYRRPSARQPAGGQRSSHYQSQTALHPQQHNHHQPPPQQLGHDPGHYTQGPGFDAPTHYGDSLYNGGEAADGPFAGGGGGGGGGFGDDLHGAPHPHAFVQQHADPQQQQHAPAPVEDERPLPVLQHAEQQRQQSPLGGGTGGVQSARSSSRLPAEEGSGAAPNLYEGDEDPGPGTDPAVIAEALAGVPGADELPEAEALPKGMSNEVQPLVDAFGEYLVRCLYSRQVRLRGAAMSKLEIDLDGKFDMTDARLFGAICTVCRMSATDKIANIYMQGVKLLEVASTRANDAGVLRRHDVLPLVEPLMVLAVDKLGNNAARIRDATAQLLQHLARLKIAGVHLVAGAVLKHLRPGKSMLWRQLLGRLKLLADLIGEFEMKEAHGLGLETVMGLITAYSGHVHPNAEVRECAKEVVLQAYAQVGEAVLPYLKDLRPKQMEEYEAGFDQIDQSQGRSPVKRSMRSDAEAKPTARSARSSRSQGSPTPGKTKKGAHKANGGGGGGGGGGSLSPEARRERQRNRRSSSQDLDEGSPRSQEVNINIDVSHGRNRDEEELLPERNGARNHEGYEEDDDDEGSYEEEPFTCQFCGRHDPDFTDDALDIHYWKECPMLTSCLQCEQVIEVAMLNDHLLNECEMKHNHERCPRCGEAIAAQYFGQHVKRASCRPVQPASKANRCPLCHDDVKPGEDGWREHILVEPGCDKNPRTEHLRG